MMKSRIKMKSWLMKGKILNGERTTISKNLIMSERNREKRTKLWSRNFK